MILNNLEHKVKMELPNDIINEILSYGDVDVTQKYEGVLLQLKFYIKEFNYHRKQPYNIWSTYDDYEYKIYALTKNRIKKYPNEYIYPRIRRYRENIINNLIITPSHIIRSIIRN